MPNLSQTGLVTGVASSVIRIASPILLSAIGALITNRAGVMNLGFEGIMLMGAFVGFLTAHQTGSLIAAVLAAAVAGGVLSLLLSFFTSTLKVDQTIVGIALNLLASGVTAFWYRVVFDVLDLQSSSIRTMGNFEIPILSETPLLGEVLFSQPLLTYFAFLMVPMVWVFLYKTKYGLKIRCLGENPHTIDSQGGNVTQMQYLATLFGGLMGGLGGGFLTIASTGVFVTDMSAGRGWLALIVVIAGNWRPFRVALFTLVFSFLEAFQLQVQSSGIQLPTQILLALPYVCAILFLVLGKTESRAPSFLGVPFYREES